MLQARERMQRKLDEDAAARAKKIEEVRKRERDEKHVTLSSVERSKE